MVSVRVVGELGAHDQHAVAAFLRSAGETDHAHLNDHLHIDLSHGPRPGFVGAIATGDDGEVVGYAQASRGNEGFVVDAIVWSRFAGDVHEARTLLLEHVVAALPAGTAVTWWTHGDDTSESIARALGMRAGRTLLQMRRSLPVEASADLAVRPFRPGHDEAQWLEVNNAAFGWHGEQGGWDLTTLRQREREPWFRADGFLLHERDGRLAGFCWTKLHPPTAVEHHTLGEIYVIAVHPDFHGLGLGRALTLAGLASLHRAGATHAMLYVDGANTAAIALYRDLGFEVSHTHQAFVTDPGADTA
jgi:mycothiol synthase